MFHNIPTAIIERMRYLEAIDAKDRQDGTERLQRLRQIPAETGKFIAMLAASAPKGDYIEIGTLLLTRLYKVLNDLNADGSGDAVIDIWPDLQVSPGDSDPLTTTQANGLFRLSSNEMPYSINEAMHYGIVIAAMSVV